VLVKRAFPNPAASGLAIGRDCLWSSDDKEGWILRHDRESYAVLDEFRSPGPAPGPLHWDGERLWSYDRKTRSSPKVVVDQRYHWRIVREEGRLDWYVDDSDTPFLTFVDPAPLAGEGHEYLGFNNWQSDAWFDNLSVAPL